MILPAVLQDIPEDAGSFCPPSPFLIIASKLVKGPVILNVGGKK
jgi:hypothetical protein